MANYNTIHKCYVDMYRQELFITFSKKGFKKMTGHTIPDHAGGCVCNTPGGYLVFWLEMDDNGLCSIPDMSHEVFHACDMIADNVGLVLSEQTGNEHFAYLTGWVMERVMHAQNEEKYLRGHLERPEAIAQRVRTTFNPEPEECITECDLDALLAEYADKINADDEEQDTDTVPGYSIDA